MNNNTVVQIRNDLNNNFNNINNIHFEDFGKIITARFCKVTKYITFLTQDLLIYQIKNFDMSISKCFRVTFPKESIDFVEGSLLTYHYCHELEVFVVLSSNKQLCIFERLNPSNQVMLRIEDYLPHKLKNLNFHRF